MRSKFYGKLASCLLGAAGTLMALPVHATCSTGPLSLSQPWSWSPGSENFGASYSLRGGIMADGSWLRGHAQLAASVRVFGQTQSILHAYGDGGMSANQLTGLAALYVMGRTVYYQSGAASYYPRWNTNFFSAGTRFWIGFLPVSTQVSASGYLGLDFSATNAAPSGVTLVATPLAGVRGVGSATIDAPYIGRAGVVGVVTLVEARSPLQNTLTRSGSTVNWRMDYDLQVSALSGGVYVWAGNDTFGYTSKWLINTPGTGYPVSLYHSTGCVNL